MPAQTRKSTRKAPRTTHRLRRTETPKLQALAFTDAVRDILREHGSFHLGDDRTRDAVWEWDGREWKRIPIAGERSPEPEVPLVEIGEDEEAVVAG